MSRRSRDAEPEDKSVYVFDPFDEEEIFGYVPRGRAVENSGWTSAAIEAVRRSEIRKMTEIIAHRHRRTYAVESWSWREMPTPRKSAADLAEAAADGVELERAS